MVARRCWISTVTDNAAAALPLRLSLLLGLALRWLDARRCRDVGWLRGGRRKLGRLEQLNRFSIHLQK